MRGVLHDIEVLDLSWGIAGPMVGMLLSDNGARVTKIEPPGGDPFRGLSGYHVWHRGKRSAMLDLRDEDDAACFRGLARRADVLVESFAPGVTDRLGLSYEALAADNPRLVYCSITAYGRTGARADRPGYDALVAASTGQLWEARGLVGTTLHRLSGRPPALGDLDAPDDMWVGPRRDGPLFAGVAWPSVGACYLATLAISAALRAREQTGLGQHVETSLLQGVLASTSMPWQRVEGGRPGYVSWVVDPRAPKAFFRCADGRWVHQWLPVPDAVLQSARTRLGAGAVPDPQRHELQVGVAIEDTPALHRCLPLMAAVFGKLPSAEWVSMATEAGFPLQAVRSPEEALLDPAFVADGCVTEVLDPAVGRIRQVGRTYVLERCASTVGGSVPVPGEHTDEVRRESVTAARHPSHVEQLGEVRGGPLDGVTVLDLGLAVAGPFGAQLLADLGADVIKISAPGDDWIDMQFGMMCNRGKRSIALNLKDPHGYRVLEELVARSDVVHINWRAEAAAKLKVDHGTLRRLKPDLVYCHTHGFEEGPRRRSPGNDQMAGALAGTEWLDGGLDAGGEPVWPNYSLGDTGNGLLSAIAVVQALFHRDRTGEGQLVETSIVYAHLLNASSAWTSADGRVAGDRPSLDADLRGWNALYRLYDTADGWICIAAVTDEHWRGLCEAVDAEDLLADARFRTRAARAAHDGELVDALQHAFGRMAAAVWCERLDQRGVPCEPSPSDAMVRLFDDHDLEARGWMTEYQHPTVGLVKMAGRLFELSRTPGRVPGRSPLWGEHTREILAELGRDQDVIDTLVAAGAVGVPE